MYYNYENEASSNHFCSDTSYILFERCHGLGLNYFVSALNFRILPLTAADNGTRRRFQVISDRHLPTIL